MSELTPWFASGTKPAREGVYETRWANKSVRPAYSQFQRWDGVHWLGWARYIEQAAALPRNVSIRQDPEWRGLTAATVQGDGA